jgi:predicted HicB family RNase H-like nuclease
MIATEEKPMPRRKQNWDRDRFEVRAEPEWIKRVTLAAARVGLSLSAYVRLVVSKQLQREEDEEALRPAPRGKGGKS